MKPPAQCGTYAAYQQHRKRGEPACAPCRKASAEYVAARRADPEVRRAEVRAGNARSKALWRLADEFPDRFRELVAEEMGRVSS